MSCVRKDKSKSAFTLHHGFKLCVPCHSLAMKKYETSPNFNAQVSLKEAYCSLLQQIHPGSWVAGNRDPRKGWFIDQRST